MRLNGANGDPRGGLWGSSCFPTAFWLWDFPRFPPTMEKLAPAKDCGLKEGDIITHINSEEVDTIEQVQSLLQNLEGDQMSIRCLRGEKQIQMTVQAVKCSSDGTYKLGAWIRDSMAGIGTMTFYDPQTGHLWRSGPRASTTWTQPNCGRFSLGA